MKTTFNLTEADLRQAVVEFVKKEKGVDVKFVRIVKQEHDRNQGFYFTATASE